MIPLAAIPLMWKVGAAAALVAALTGAHIYRVAQADSAGYDRAVSERLAQDAASIMTRARENAALDAKQTATNATITKGKNDEIDKLRARLAASERMRKPAFCNQSAGSTYPESARSGSLAYPGAGLVPERVEQDIRALILKTEEVAATARACQAFVRENNLAP